MTALAGARVVHVTSVSLGLSATAAATVGHAIDLARSGRALVSFDFNYRAAPGHIATDNTRPLRDDPERFTAILDRIPTGGEEPRRPCGGDRFPRLARRRLRLGHGTAGRGRRPFYVTCTAVQTLHTGIVVGVGESQARTKVG
jgi:hypothetical protein